MIGRALAIWLVMLAIASANGAVREAFLIPAFGETGGRAISTLSLTALVVLLTWATIGWIRPGSAGEAWTVGGLWLALTLAFEFLAGRYLFGQPWARLLEDYNVLRGRIWVLVLVTIVVAPRLCAQLRGLLTVGR